MFEVKTMNTWANISTQKPLVIAGPCSAETEDQVIKTAVDLANTGVQIYRAGIWKPRTRPGSFEGIGSEGLTWLRNVKAVTGMLTATEVANIKHVYESLKAGVDIIWIGARTTANPFAMQEIADALKGVDIPVLVKNPVNPDLDLWIGGIERLAKVGITKLGAIHRGFSTYEKTMYRNIPQWQIPIELKRRIPSLPLICDPSHISGDRKLIFDVSQKALDLNFDGLMIESHHDPDNAWSDAKQQVTPAVLAQIIKDLVIREMTPAGVSTESLDELRFKIDILDNELIQLLRKRMDIAEGIGKYKKDNNMMVLQPGRWDKIISKYIEKAANLELSDDFITKIFHAIHQESINKQMNILNSKKD